jgi:hypothetical protein
VASKGSFGWAPDRALFNSVEDVVRYAKAYLSRATQFHALRAETYMKSHAPWADRTGNARAGLATFAAVDSSRSMHYEIIVYGQVNYQFWLETRWPEGGVGRYAIIIPTIREESPAYFETARKIMAVLFGGESL